MNYHDLIKDSEIIEIRNGDREEPVTDVVYNSRKAKKGSMFVAIFGFATDGHEFIEDAVAHGASIVVHQADLEKYHPDVVYIKVTDCRKMLGRIANRFFDKPSQKITVTGITGTNGKTSTTYFLCDILKRAGHKCARMGTIENQIGDEIIDNKGRTTSESRDLQAFIARAVEEKCDELVMEASSQALDLERLCDVSFNYALFTNLTQDHLDYHKTFENYFEAKAKLFDQTTGAAIINCDDPWGEKLIARIKQKNPDLTIITYGTQKACDYRVEEVQCTTAGSSFTLVHGEESVRIFLDVIGRFMVYNATAAIIAAREEGVSWDIITQALKAAPVVEGRMERVKTNLDFDIVVDFAHTPDALKNLLETVRELCTGKIILLFGCGGDRDKGKRPLMGEIAAKGADFSVITSDNSRTEDPDEIISEIEAAVKPLTREYVTVTKRREATRVALKKAKKGDVVLFAGKGHEKTETSREGVRPYYEKAVILDVLSEEKMDEA
ncbi:MAG: UDP-N-acetylmuramoyl-L-alanyl-D-glutamate--2,6-diaminopimelate ligase [Eubacteriaceae bacterium]|nr:UDP-N-acetylmuramoyl-L-alanyl-D-glutamate--2,6-diaminopimelate ligase [Eubacteriaceae bacterium]